MWHPILATAMQAFAVGIGIAVVATFLLRWYRMRQEFILMRLALERGLNPQLIPPQPQWLISLRQGLMIIALGVGLLTAGAIGWSMAAKVQRPQQIDLLNNPTSALGAIIPDALLDPGPPGGRGAGPEGQRPPRPPEPPRRDPQKEAWDRAQNQISVCMAMVGAGGILILLGLIRLILVPLERRYVVPSGVASTPSASSAA